MFTNRHDAGQQLADALRLVSGPHALVLGLPRGGVIVAAVVARELHAELDVVLVKKLRAPGNPELAVGAVAEDGSVYLNPEVIGAAGASESYLAQERDDRFGEIQIQAAAYRAVRPRATITGRTIVLVDDGLATGATMIAAVQCTALAQPDQLIVAVPVSPPETARTIADLESVDQFVCLHTPAWFSGVGQFYRDFQQVPDEEVVRVLTEAKQ